MSYLFKKNTQCLNVNILRRWRREAVSNLEFVGKWSGYWETCVDGITYRSEMVSGFRYVVGDTGSFIQDVLIDRAKLKKNGKVLPPSRQT